MSHVQELGKLVPLRQRLKVYVTVNHVTRLHRMNLRVENRANVSNLVKIWFLIIYYIVVRNVLRRVATNAHQGLRL